VQSDASFCGQCGFDLRTATTPAAASASSPPDYELTSPGDDEAEIEIPDLLPPDPLVISEELPATPESLSTPAAEPLVSPNAAPSIPVSLEAEAGQNSLPTTTPPSTTQLQLTEAKLFHVQTNTPVELPKELSILHIGKPNDRIPPTIDVSGFPNSEIVSRVHADIRVEGDVYFIEDVGSSNGTYINNLPLPPGNRHRLRGGDRIALGKGDKVTFIFQSS
jgi:predicted component of type VI protein secretion system